MSKLQAQQVCALTQMHFQTHVMVINPSLPLPPCSVTPPPLCRASDTLCHHAPDTAATANTATASKTCVDFVCICIAHSAFAVPHRRWFVGRHRQFVRMLNATPRTVTHIPSLQLIRACGHLVAKRGSDADAKRLLLTVYRQAAQKSGLPWAAMAVDVTLLLRAFPGVAADTGVDIVEAVFRGSNTRVSPSAGLVLLAAKIVDALQQPPPLIEALSVPLVRAMLAHGLPVTTFSSTMWRLCYLVAHRTFAKQLAATRLWWASLAECDERKQLVAALLLRAGLYPVLLQVMSYSDTTAMCATWAWVMARVRINLIAGADGLCLLPLKVMTMVVTWHPPVTEDEDCCVCYEPLADPLLPCASFRCGHTLHCACMYEWAVSQEPRIATCPMCRTPTQEFQDLDDEVLSVDSF